MLFCLQEENKTKEKIFMLSLNALTIPSKSMATKMVQNDQDAEPEQADEENPVVELESNMKTTDKKRRIDSQNVTLIDPEILDCYICYKPLAIPIFEVCFLHPLYPNLLSHY